MSQTKLNNRQRRERWQQAVKLAKKGQYSKARYMLQDMDDDPQVRRLLERIEGRSDKFTGGIQGFFNITVVIIVVIGVAILAIMWNFSQSFQQETTNRSELNAQYEVLGLDGGRALFEDLLTVCLDSTNNASTPCVTWSAEFLTAHQGALPMCTLLNDDGSIDFRGQAPADLGMCLTSQPDVPPLPPSA